MLEYLKFKYSLFGIDAPAFAWLVGLGLILYTLYSTILLSIKLRNRLKEFKKAENFLKEFEAGITEGTGIGEAELKSVRRFFVEEAAKPLKSAWLEFERQVIDRLRGGEKRYWSSSDADDSFSERKLVTDSLNRTYYQSIPGIVTGIGLLTTFLAILVALLDVRLIDNRVQGLELLIQGLSGKFISSVVALLCATVFVVFEKNRFHALERGQLRLASAVNHVVPRLSAAQILVDLHTDFTKFHHETAKSFANFQDETVKGLSGVSTEIKHGIGQVVERAALLQEDVARQTVCIQDFNTGLAPILQQTFDESMTPTLNRMVDSIEGMNEHLRAAEANKNDTITGSIETLLSDLQQSIAGSISEMGGKFNESLSGSAQAQFNAVTDSLANTTALLNGMNEQFVSSQTALQEMINHARSTTQEQVSMNNSQIKLFTDTIGRVMIDLSDRVNELGEQMSESVQSNAAQAAGAADKVIAQAQTLSEENASRLARLLEVHELQMDRVVKAREMLDAMITRFSESLENVSTISLGSQNSVQQISSAVASITLAADKIASTQQTLQKLSELAVDQLNSLDDANREQREVWNTIHGNMGQYQNTFTTVENQAALLLEQIGSNLENYQQVCEKGFNKLIESSDSHFTNATQKLGASVSELDEVLQDLSESFGRLEVVRSNGHG